MKKTEEFERKGASRPSAGVHPKVHQALHRKPGVRATAQTAARRKGRIR